MITAIYARKSTDQGGVHDEVTDTRPGKGGRRQPDCCTPHSGHTAVRSGSINKPDPCASPSPEVPPDKFSRRSEWVFLEYKRRRDGVREVFSQD